MSLVLPVGLIVVSRSARSSRWVGRSAGSERQISGDHSIECPLTRRRAELDATLMVREVMVIAAFW